METEATIQAVFQQNLPYPPLGAQGYANERSLDARFCAFAGEDACAALAIRRAQNGEAGRRQALPVREIQAVRDAATLPQAAP